MENARLYELERESVRRLRELDAMKTDFLATVQHEMRTPLTAILGLSDLIEMCWDAWEDSPEARRAARHPGCRKESRRDRRDDHRLLGRRRGGAGAGALRTCRWRTRLAPRSTVVGERHKGGLPVPAEVDVAPALALRADPDRLGQVLRALIDNAVKFSDGQGTRARARRRRRDGVVLVEVIDQGIGIPAEDVPRIFERFFQVDNTATRRFGGTGMGLALVKRVVDAHGATVEVETRPGSGTRMSLRWPERRGARRMRATTTDAPPRVPVQ